MYAHVKFVRRSAAASSSVHLMGHEHPHASFKPARIISALSVICEHAPAVLMAAQLMPVVPLMVASSSRHLPAVDAPVGDATVGAAVAAVAVAAAAATGHEHPHLVCAPIALSCALPVICAQAPPALMVVQFMPV